MSIERLPVPSLQRQEQLFLAPLTDFEINRELIYSNKVPLSIGLHEKTLFRDESISVERPYTRSVLGGAFGDEGKGRFIDNLIDDMFSQPGIQRVYVVRYQGGNNAGHTLEKGGKKVALHAVPSFVLHENAYGVMDKGEVIHPEDLQTELRYIQRETGQDVTNRLLLSEHAIVCTDLERAEELLNEANQGDAGGGTRRGMSPSYARFIDRTGVTISHLLAEDWEKKFGKKYDQYKTMFRAASRDLKRKDLRKIAKVKVPNFKGTKLGEGKATRGVGTKKQYLQRLREAREWLKQSGMVTDTQDLYRQIHKDRSVGILFEGSQAAGLDAYNGTRPDVTSSDTTISGIKAGTGYWLSENIEDSYAVIKATYTSSVGKRRNPTHVDASNAPDADEDQKWAAWVQEEAHEQGTTTGRFRDIDIIDWEMLRFNLRISGAKKLVATHLDIAREGQKVKVCTSYKYADGTPAYYHPNQAELNKVVPQYIELDGWDGEACRNAKTFEDLPINAQRYLMLMQVSLGYPIVGVTTGPDRDNLITFPGYTQQQAA